MKRKRRPAKIADSDLQALARIADLEDWKVLRKLKQATAYNYIQKAVKFPTNDPNALVANQAWTQGLLYALKSEINQIESAKSELEKREKEKDKKGV